MGINHRKRHNTATAVSVYSGVVEEWEWYEHERKPESLRGNLLPEALQDSADEP
jgi:hypothetical protein